MRVARSLLSEHACVIFNVIMLAASLAGKTVPPASMVSAAEDVRSVVLESPSLFAGDDGKTRTALLLIVWMWKESAWRTDALGDCDDPAHRTVATCRSFGAMQMQRHFLKDQVHAVLGDRQLALRLALNVMIELRDKCGSVRSGLDAYASGKCKGNAHSHAIVAWRCHLSHAC